MNRGSISVTRAQLYEQAWSKPIPALAAEYGFSGVGLAKLFKRLAIPTPPRGYWARKAADKTVTRPPLPPCPSGRSGEVRLWGRVEPTPIAPEEGATRHAEEKRGPDRRIVVPHALEAPHPLVRLSRPLLKRAKNDLGTLLQKESCLDIQVGPASIDRALLIMDTLLKALNDRGLSTDLRPPAGNEPHRRWYERKPSRTVVHVGDDLVLIAVTESERPAPRAPGESIKEYVYTGSLTIVVETEGWPRGCRRVRDGRALRLEDKLNEVVGWVLLLAEDRRQARLKEEQAERERQEVERRRAEQAMRQRIEAVWVHDLTRRMEDWRTAKEVRSFVDDVESNRPAQDVPWPAGAWVVWAQRYADRCQEAALSRIAERVRLPPAPSDSAWNAPKLPDPIPVPFW